MLHIYMRNGNIINYNGDQFTDYQYDGKYFVVIKGKQWVGFYNLDCVEFIQYEDPQPNINMADMMSAFAPSNPAVTEEK